MRTAAHARTAAAAALLASLVLLSGCIFGESLPDTEPDIRGTATDVTASDDGASVTFLLTDLESELGAAVITVTSDTRVLLDDGGSRLVRVDGSEIAEGDTVRVWITGPVRESYPVQADAGTVLIEGEAR